MSKKYTFTINADKAIAEKLIEKAAESRDIYFKAFHGELIVRKSAFAFGVIPVSFQTSFICALKAFNGKTIIEGKFGVPKLFYQICTEAFFAFALLFFAETLFNKGNAAVVFILLALFFLFMLFIIWIFVKLANKIFSKQNKVVINFFEDLEKIRCS